VSTTWDILIRTIPHRHERLCGLLESLAPQMRMRSRHVGILVYRDNLEATPGAKAQALTEASRAEYVSFVDDDDEVSPDYVRRILVALNTEPDYVGFTVRYSVDGQDRALIEHSLRYPGWETRADGRHVRDISHLNPVRRRLALLARWDDGYGEDHRWAQAMRETGLVNREVFLDGDPLYHYRYSTEDHVDREQTVRVRMLQQMSGSTVTGLAWPPPVSHGGGSVDVLPWEADDLIRLGTAELASPQPMSAADILALPSYPWLRVVEP
jgi:hypothetical protein